MASTTYKIERSTKGTPFTRVPLTAKNIGELLDALADQRDPFGDDPTHLEMRLQEIKRELDRVQA